MDYRKIKLGVLVLLLSFVMLPTFAGCVRNKDKNTSFVRDIIETNLGGRSEPCPVCHGVASKALGKCARCDGTGRVFIKER